VNAQADNLIVAAFDVDKTLTSRDCVLPFLRRCRPVPTSIAKMLLQTADLLKGFVRRDRDLLKVVATRAAVGGKEVGATEAMARQYALDCVVQWLRHDTATRVKWHLEQHHRVVLVSASYEIYVQHLAGFLGVEAVLATRLAHESGRFTGELIGANCRGPEKARRLRDWIAENVGDPEGTVVWAYGDSAGDREMLAMADHPVWVTGRQLESIAIG
jgi:phosphatidylglycerophosphatase C